MLPLTATGHPAPHLQLPNRPDTCSVLVPLQMLRAQLGSLQSVVTILRES